MNIAIIIVSVVFGMCLLPVAVALASLAIANLIGCAPDNASTCLVAGFDFRGPLYTGMMMHWFAILTLPFAALSGLVLVILLIVRAVRRRA